MLSDILPGSAPQSAILSSSIAVVIIWSLWFVLLTTVTLRYYALHITPSPSPRHTKQKRKGSINSTTSCSSPSPLQTKTTTGIIFFILFLATAHILGTTFTIIWQDQLGLMMQGSLIANGGDLGEWSTDIMTKGTEENTLRDSIEKMAISLGLVLLTILWAVKGVFIILFWGIAGSLGLGDVHLSEGPDKKVKGRQNTEKQEKKKLPPTPKDKAARAAYLTLFTTSVIILISYPLLLTTQAILSGIVLGRDLTTYSLDTTLPSAYVMTEIILTSIFDIPTTLLLIAIPVLFFQALELRRGRLRGAWLMGSLALAVVAVQCTRLAVIVTNGMGSSIMLEDGRVMKNWENVERGLDAKVLAVFEICINGVAACGPGLRILMSRRRGYGKRQSRKRERDLEEGHPKTERQREISGVDSRIKSSTGRHRRYQDPQTSSFGGWNPNYGLESGGLGIRISTSEVGVLQVAQYSHRQKGTWTGSHTRRDQSSVRRGSTPRYPSSSMYRPKSSTSSRVSLPAWQPLNIKKSRSISPRQARDTGTRTSGATSRGSRTSFRRDRRGHERLESVDHSEGWVG